LTNLTPDELHNELEKNKNKPEEKLMDNKEEPPKVSKTDKEEKKVKNGTGRVSGTNNIFIFLFIIQFEIQIFFHTFI
jgi:hypothetical protein